MSCAFDIWKYLLLSPDETELSKNPQVLIVTSKTCFLICPTENQAKFGGCYFLSSNILIT